MLNRTAAIAAALALLPAAPLAEEPAPNVEAPVETAAAGPGAPAPAEQDPSLYQTVGNSVAMAAANAVYAEQQANVTYQAETTVGVAEQIGPAEQPQEPWAGEPVS